MDTIEGALKRSLSDSESEKPFILQSFTISSITVPNSRLKSTAEGK